MRLLGQSEFAARYLSLFFGVVSVPIILHLGKAMGWPKIGALAALLLAINPFQVWHAQDARNYTFWPAPSMAGMCLLLVALREGKTRHWVGYTAMTLLSLYAHYYDLFLLLFQNLFVLGFIVWRWRQKGAFNVRLRRTVYTWMAIQALLTLAFGPWLLHGSSRFVAITEGDSPHQWEVFFRCITAFSMGETMLAFGDTPPKGGSYQSHPPTHSHAANRVSALRATWQRRRTPSWHIWWSSCWTT